MKELKQYLNESGIEFTEKNGLIRVPGDLYYQDDVDYSTPQSVRQSLDCENATSVSLPVLESVGDSLYCDCEADICGKKYNIRMIDNIPCVINGKSRNVDGFTIQKAVIAKNFKCGVFNNNEICYIAERDGVFAHGKTIKQAMYDVEFKGIDRESECQKYKDYDMDTTLSVEDWYLVYRNITGACSLGAWSFINGGNFAGEYTLKQVIELTSGQYNSETFREFFKNIA